MAVERTPFTVEDDTSDKDKRVARIRGVLENPEEPVPKLKKPETKHAREHIGHMLLSSEASQEEQHRQDPEIVSVPVAAEKNRETHSPAKPENAKRIDTLNRAELMALGEKITIEDGNLRQMYETHLIGERGLRRLVAEYLSGGDLRKALRDEVLERERDFERDPVMRDLPLSSGVQTAADGTAALDQLLQKAAVSVADSGEEAAFFKARARYEATHQQQQYKQQRRIIDISLVVIITTLLGVVVAMYLTRG